MKPSEEIRRVIERWTLALAEDDRDSMLARLSNEPGTLIIGTDPAEWWLGAEAHAIWARQIQEVGSFPVSATEIDAWEEGSVGWAGVKETVDWEGRTIESRATYVLHLERGEWKVVHIHWSFPKANAETLGRSPISIYLYVKDADKTFAKAVKAGATVTMPLADMFWGDRIGQLKDPFGYHWTIATHTKDLTDDEIKQAGATFLASFTK